jgi:hypothetical protein
MSADADVYAEGGVPLAFAHASPPHVAGPIRPSAVSVVVQLAALSIVLS